VAPDRYDGPLRDDGNPALSYFGYSTAESDYGYRSGIGSSLFARHTRPVNTYRTDYEIIAESTVLRYHEEMVFERIGIVLYHSANVVEKLLLRAIERLRHEWEKPS
jgi:hypothetical protein